MIDKALVEAWVNQNTPASIKDILLDGIDMVYRDGAAVERTSSIYLNERKHFSEKEANLILELDDMISDPNITAEKIKALEEMFGRPFKSLKDRLRYSKTKGCAGGQV